LTDEASLSSLEEVNNSSEEPLPYTHWKTIKKKARISSILTGRSKSLARRSGILTGRSKSLARRSSTILTGRSKSLARSSYALIGRSKSRIRGDINILCRPLLLVIIDHQLTKFIAYTRNTTLVATDSMKEAVCGILSYNDGKVDIALNYIALVVDIVPLVLGLRILPVSFKGLRIFWIPFTVLLFAFQVR
jgi:hypothetical protein